MEFPLSERIEAEVRRLMAQHAAIEPRGFDTIAKRREIHALWDARYEEWLEVNLLEQYEPEFAGIDQ